MDDLLRDFLTESGENLLKIEQEMVELEQRPGDADLLASIFRSMHTIKGTCGFLGLERLGGVTHSAENVLGALRDGEIELSDGVVSDVLAAADVVREILEGLETTQEEPMGDDSQLIARLDAWLGDDGDRTEESLDLLFQSAKAAAATAADGPDGGEAEVGAKGDGAAGAPSPPPEPAAAAPAEEGGAKEPGGGDAAGKEGSKRSLADATLRVDVDVLDLLMNLAGELVLTRNQLMQLTQKDEDSLYQTPVQQLNRVTTDLQGAVMRTRMQPIGNAWGKLPRLVRDLASASRKQLNLVMLGAETELDRQILQAIKDPLTHMIRNSADHGVEMPAERAAAGKPERGEIVLEAFHEGGHIVIEIRDDGRGLDPELIRAKAVEKGLVGADEARTLPDHRVFEFILEPGFSTAQQVTAVSGRGVGMDVVKRNIEKIGGTIELHSIVGQGTTVRIKIPLTLAIMSALIVGVRDQSFAVPQIGVLELVRVAETNRHLVEDVNGALFYRLRDNLLPLVRLDHVLGFPREEEEDVANILVCQVGPSRFGLIVDSILDTHEIVVKPVGRMVKSVRAYAGTTILGDGRVIMILDVAGIAQTTDVLTRGQTRDESDAAKSHLGKGTSLLLFDAGTEAPRAVPLSQVARLEEFALEDIEWADGRWVVQYREQLLPIIPASESVDLKALDPRPVIVFTDGVHSMGLAVEAIRDIVQEVVAVEAESESVGLIGSAVVSGKTTELVDIDYYLMQSRPPSERREYEEAHAAATNGNGHRGANGGGNGHEANGHQKVLLVDDSPFFLNMLGPVLRAEGYDVVMSQDGRHALSRLERGEVFDLVVSDIDMPRMDGFELAEKVRAEGMVDLPLIALTSRSSEEDREHGYEVGFDQYLRKFDQKEVVAAVNATLADHEAAEADKEEVPA